MVNDKRNNKGLISVQLLRGIAALLVITYHISVKAEQRGLADSHYFSIGSCGVDLFFVISGFIMCYTTTSTTTCKKFVQSRITRVFPPYWILTTIALVVYLVKPSLVNASGGTTSILASYILLPSGDKFLVQNGWTLSYEMVFYLFYAFSLCFFPNLKNLVVTVMLSGVFIFGLVFNTSSNPYLLFLFNDLFLEFLLGIIAYEIFVRTKLSLTSSLIVLMLSITMLIFMNGQSSGYRVVFFGIPMFLLFLSVINLENYFSTKNKLSFLGDISYSLYLVHPFILSPLALVLAYVGVTNNLVFFIILMSFSILASYIFYKQIEYPVTNKIKQLTQKYSFT
ncbi:acyltransferase family protein [Raoultella planticola]|uniref:acyltransferase family protein n=1 Tax=Raoultella planticola TaxID=575 RepID=UPI0034E5A1D5